jgi:hypothetical protein
MIHLDLIQERRSNSTAPADASNSPFAELALSELWEDVRVTISHQLDLNIVLCGQYVQQ